MNSGLVLRTPRNDASLPFSRSCERKIRIFLLRRRANHWHWSALARAAMRDASRSSRNVARVAMDAAASGSLLPDETFAAYGEVVWSWRRDRGVYPFRPVLGRQR